VLLFFGCWVFSSVAEWEKRDEGASSMHTFDAHFACFLFLCMLPMHVQTTSRPNSILPYASLTTHFLSYPDDERNMRDENNKASSVVIVKRKSVV
jgi:hypothetical protein